MAGASRTTQSREPNPPRLWLLMGHRAGDNAQVLALAEALGWPFEVKRFVYRKYELATNLLLGPTLAGIVRARSSPLAPPWPDLVISAGRRNEPVARWIQARSGGRARLVHLGRPWARIERFDLVITTPQYDLPNRPNVLVIEAPLHRITPARLAEAAAEWRPRLAHLPRPCIALLVGGNSAPYRLDARTAARLGREASAMAAAAGGSLLVTTSARTPTDAVAALKTVIDRPCFFYRWTAEAADNPYLAYLALADAIVVTGDSVSMVAEACATDKPVYLFDPGRGRMSMREPRRSRSVAEEIRDFDAIGLLHRTMMRLGPARMRRDIGAMLRRLVASGRAAWLGDGPPSATPQPLADLPRAAARVRGLFDAATDGRSDPTDHAAAGREPSGGVRSSTSSASWRR